MARQNFRIDGLRQCEAALKELPRATGKNVLRRSLIKAAQPIAADARARADKRTGRLQMSIDVSTKLSRRQRAKNRKKSAVEVYVGAGPLPQAHMEEFGGAHNTPSPYMRPAVDGNVAGVTRSFKQDLTDEVMKAAARLARKTARLR